MRGRVAVTLLLRFAQPKSAHWRNIEDILEPVQKLVESDESVVIQGSTWRVEVPLVDGGESAAVSA